MERIQELRINETKYSAVLNDDLKILVTFHSFQFGINYVFRLHHQFWAVGVLKSETIPPRWR